MVKDSISFESKYICIIYESDVNSNINSSILLI